MDEKPQAVQDTLEKLKQKEQSYVEIKKIRGRYCVYRSTSVWDKKLKKAKKKSEYLAVTL